MNKFAALLHEKWVAGKKPDCIIGVWAEDFSNYEIHVPFQLRNSLILLQNILSDRYQELVTTRNTLAKMESLLEKVLGA